MNSSLGKDLGIALALVCFVLAGVPLRALPFPEPMKEAVVFIVNKANPMDEVTSAELRRLFKSERSSWPDGRKVTLVMLDPGRKEREIVLHNLCGMSESDYGKFMLQAVFSGNARNDPKVLADGAGAVKFVSLVPGAIGYAAAGQVDASVKALKVDGLAPTATGYKYTIQ